MGMDKKDVLGILKRKAILSDSVARLVTSLQKESQKTVEDILIENMLVEKNDILAAKAEMMEVDFIDLKNYEIADPQIPVSVSKAVSLRYVLIPVAKEGDMLTVAMKDPADFFAVDEVRLMTSKIIKPALADEEEIKKLIAVFFPDEPVRRRMNPAARAEADEDGGFGLKASEPKQERRSARAESDKAYGDRQYTSKKKIGKILQEEGLLTEAQLQSALDLQKEKGGPIGQILIDEGFIEKDVFYEHLSRQLNIGYINPDEAEIPDEIVKLISPDFSRKNLVIPIEKQDLKLKVATSDPFNIFALDDMRLITGLDIVPVLADRESIKSALDRHFGAKAEKAAPKVSLAPAQDNGAGDRNLEQEFEKELQKVQKEIEFEIEKADEDNNTIDVSDIDNAPIVKMVNMIIHRAILSGASDIHIEPYEDAVAVRYRIDGQLVETMKQDYKILSALTARIKIISGLNIAEKRIPQDGRISLKFEGKGYDLRVSVLPVIHGEKIVIRIAGKEGFNVDKKELGFFEDDLIKFDDILAHPHGIVLVTGPTGSGKSTTLYTALKELCKPNVNILTVEDPVESDIRGVNQVQVNAKAGLTFAAALRSFLRQDPDIIMVGEIRDGETAEIAVRAAITGHLVLSTLHTNDAASTISRMVDMGVEPFLISSSVVGVIAQRLVRRLCTKCREEYSPDPEEKKLLGMDENDSAPVYRHIGCPVCSNTGYRGRIAVYEIMTVNSELRDMITRHATVSELRAKAIDSGMSTLAVNCARLVRTGVTTIDEMLRIAHVKD